MGLQDVYDGRQSWAEFISSRAQSEGSTESGPTGGNIVKVNLSSKDYRLALDSGLGAVNDLSGTEIGLELGTEKLSGGIAKLNADFNFLLGDLIWKYEMCEETLNSILQEIRLAEFEREARAYRSRAERAYLNGWYKEALDDFFEAEKRNYPDYAVHRSIASIYLYHQIDLAKALEYFLKAAKYARPGDPRRSAEAHYFAGMIYLIGQELEPAYEHLQEAVKLDTELYEAYYQQARLAVRLGRIPSAVKALEIAISGDARYYERAKSDFCFDPIRTEVRGLLEELMHPLQEKVKEVRRDAESLKGFVIAGPEEEKLIESFQQVEEEMASGLTYQSGLRVLGTLTHIQSEIRGIHDRFYKRYEIDPRDYIRSVAFSSDGRLIAAGFLNGGIQVWDVDSGLKVYSISGHLASVNSVAFSPDNQWLVSGSRDRKIKLWEAESGIGFQTLSGHTGEVRSVAFSPDGQWLVSGSHDRSIRIWRVASGHEVQALDGHYQQVTSALFCPDGSLIASGSWDKTIKLWDVLSGQVVTTLRGHLRGVASLAFSPDGRWLASGGEDANVRLWEVETGNQLQTFKGFNNGVNSVAFNPNGGLLAAGSLGQSVIVWKIVTGAVVKQLRYQNISYNSVAFSPKGQWLALGSRDLQLWLKVILTPEEFASVKEGEQRASVASRFEEELLSPLYVSRSRARKNPKQTKNNKTNENF
jgi:tetratricopeptide (TPR) repeat protein